MASDKRNFTNFDNQNDFAGHINEDKNLYEFPTLYKAASTNTGKPRQWTIYCRLIKQDSKDEKLTKSQNWNMLQEIEVPMKDKYLINGEKIPEGIIAQLWTENGIIDMKISRSAATYVEIPKNKGKKNERNVLQQALVQMRGKYLKKMDEGSSILLEMEIDNIEVSPTTKYYPMLAKKFEDYEDKITYPVAVQPKLDGNRCVTFLSTIDEPTYKDVLMYTRSHKELPFNKVNDGIRKALLELLILYYDKKNNQSIYFDGELYKHNKSLQDINSDARGQDANEGDIQYWIYDHFYPNYDNQDFDYRTEILDAILSNLDKKDRKIIIGVKTKLINSREELDDYYKYILSENFEGLMIRTLSGPYLKSATKKSEQLRSKDLLKRKEVHDGEFEVIAYTQGKNGKEIGAVIWICAANNDVNDEFHVTPNMPLEERYKIYNDCLKKFDSKYKGRMMTVQYRSLSDKGIPLQAKAIAFRDSK
ncbi:MAG: hypothetical protein ACRCZI_02080 [Cetobacterium sp.]